MINKVTLIGRLGKDPVIRSFSNENSIADFTVATSDGYKDREGKWIEQTDWHNVRLPYKWMADRAEKTLKKGSLVYIEGKIKNRSYDDKDGVKKYVTEIVADNFKALEKRENSGGEGGNQSGQEGQSSPQHQTDSGRDFSEDLPF